MRLKTMAQNMFGLDLVNDEGKAMRGLGVSQVDAHSNLKKKGIELLVKFGKHLWFNGFFIPGAISMYPKRPDTKCTKTKLVVVFTLYHLLTSKGLPYTVALET